MEESFSPEKDSIKIGDTIWLSATHTSIFIDATNNQEINFSNSSLGANVRILQLPDNSSDVSGAINDFSIIKTFGIEGGNDNIPSENKGYYFEERGSDYALKLGFVSQKKGIYAISLGNSMGVTQNGKACLKANIEIQNNNKDNHLYYYQNWRTGYTISDYERTHMYCFKVY